MGSRADALVDLVGAAVEAVAIFLAGIGLAAIERAVAAAEPEYSFPPWAFEPVFGDRGLLIGWRAVARA